MLTITYPALGYFLATKYISFAKAHMSLQNMRSLYPTLTDINNKMSELSELIEDVQDQLQNVSNKVDEQDVRIAELEEERDELKLKIDRKDERVSELENELDDLREQFADLQAEYSDADLIKE